MQQGFPNKWIGNRGVIEWPARSPDLSPLDYFLWGMIKNKIFKRRFHNVDQLRNIIIAEFRSIPCRSIQRALNNIRKRIRLCLEQNGFLFEHIF